MRAILIIAGVIGVVYFPMSLPLTATLFIPVAPALLLLVAARVPRENYDRLLAWIGMLLAVIVLNEWVTHLLSHVTPFEERTKSALQMLYSGVVCLCLLESRPLTGRERTVIACGLGAFSVLMAMVALFENGTVIGRVSDAFRQVAYAGSSLYEADYRDMILAGRIRPKAFTSEPSHSAWGISAIMLTAMALWRIPALVVTGACVFAVSAYAFASPIPVIAACAFAIIVASSLIAHTGRWQIIAMGAALLLVIGGLLYFVREVPWLRDRYMTGGVIEDSTYIRVIMPFEIASAALKWNAIFGVGFGGEEEIGTAFRLPDWVSPDTPLNRFVGNPMCGFAIFGGLTGLGIAAYLLVRSTLRLHKTERITWLVFVVLFSSIKGSVVNASMWSVLPIIFGALASRHRVEASSVTDKVRVPKGIATGPSGSGPIPVPEPIGRNRLPGGAWIGAD